MGDDTFKWETSESRPKPWFIKVGRYCINVHDIVGIVPQQEDKHQIVPTYTIFLRLGMLGAVKLDAAEWAMMEAWIEKNAEVLTKPTNLA